MTAAATERFNSTAMTSTATRGTSSRTSPVSLPNCCRSSRLGDGLERAGAADFGLEPEQVHQQHGGEEAAGHKEQGRSLGRLGVDAGHGLVENFGGVGAVLLVAGLEGQRLLE